MRFHFPLFKSMSKTPSSKHKTFCELRDFIQNSAFSITHFSCNMSKKNALTHGDGNPDIEEMFSSHRTTKFQNIILIKYEIYAK